MKDKCNCGQRVYGYGDGIHEIWLCYKCGRFTGKAGEDKEFRILANNHPEVIMIMIKEKLLAPIDKKNKYGR
jgi:hypothetical protein